MKLTSLFSFSSAIIAIVAMAFEVGAQNDTMAGMHGMSMTAQKSDSGTSVSKAGKSHAKAGTKQVKKALIPQKTCPVQGDPIDTSVYVDYKGKRVYFCCAGCPDVFNKDPEKYLKILKDKGEEPIPIPK